MQNNSRRPHFIGRSTLALIPPVRQRTSRLTRWESFIYTRHEVATLYFYIKNFSPAPIYNLARDFMLAREIRGLGVPGSAYVAREGCAVLLRIGRCLVDGRDLSVLSAEIYPTLSLTTPMLLPHPPPLRLSLWVQYVWCDK